MARDLILGRSSRSCSRGSGPSAVGTDVQTVTDYFRKNPLSYRTKTGVLLGIGLLVFIFARKQGD